MAENIKSALILLLKRRQALFNQRDNVLNIFWLFSPNDKRAYARGRI